MDCKLIRLDLVPFHFGEIEDGARRAVEDHLAACPECLRAYFALKRSAETIELKPSPAAASRLRDAVAREVERSSGPVPWSWWERPLAVAVACSALFVAAAVAGVIG